MLKKYVSEVVVSYRFNIETEADNMAQATELARRILTDNKTDLRVIVGLVSRDTKVVNTRLKDSAPDPLTRPGDEPSPKPPARKIAAVKAPSPVSKALADFTAKSVAGTSHGPVKAEGKAVVMLDDPKKPPLKGKTGDKISVYGLTSQAKHLTPIVRDKKDSFLDNGSKVPDTFPILYPQGYAGLEKRLKCIPWALLSENEDQVFVNHNKSLRWLYEEGGLAPSEMVAIIERKLWKARNELAALDKLLFLLRDWESKRNHLTLP